ncbi:alanyl-tRNA editing protein AlaX-L [Peptacetobacter hominis]|uniref:Alanine--tRNA ligase n=1 Tax=Peptacetobacter hominis TaxID=2743610 RepID=A0A544QWG6_9FIRM|nr:DHHA1 domain-containing protein [Peptacetobacter hominis]TQQ85025.1 alanyl-tRNA editing protein AlaX-L [Peptacetobacter hominis]
MEKLYYTDKYCKNFRAKVMDIKNDGERYYIELDKTAFFPGGGGQFCDTGYVGKAYVSDMMEKDGKVIHITESIPEIDNDGYVDCSIEWDKRLDGMQQHLGQHVLSGCFYTLFGKNTCGFHLGREISTVDIEGSVDEEQIIKVESMANDIISDNIEVEVYTPSKDELKNTWTRRKLPDTDSEIRIVKIGELDTNACCGCHPDYTSELRMIKIKRVEKHKGNSRIEFLAGKRAVNYSLERDRVMSDVCRHLSCSEENLKGCVDNLEFRIKELSEKRKNLEDKLMVYRIKELNDKIENINGIDVISNIFIGEEIEYVSRIAKEILTSENIIILFACINEDKVNVIFSRSDIKNDINISEVLKKVMPIVDGKGGGNNKMAQGGGINSENAEKMLEKAKTIIEEMLY